MNVQELHKLQQAYSEVYQNTYSKINESVQNYILEYLINEGYANTEESALVIMGNMSEEWKHNIIEEKELDVLKYAELARLRGIAFGTKAFKDGWDKSPSNPNSPNWNPKSVKTPGV